jgi:alpha-L-fucosidase
MTMNETWGYKSYANDWKSTTTLVRNLIDIASKGGNYLLNVGPKADGTFPQESITILKEMGAWMKVNGEAIYGSEKSPLAPVNWGRVTKKNDNGKETLYLFVFDWPKDGKLVVPGLKNEIRTVKFLATNKSLKAKKENGEWTIKLPDGAIYPVATVIKVE